MNPFSLNQFLTLLMLGLNIYMASILKDKAGDNLIKVQKNLGMGDNRSYSLMVQSSLKLVKAQSMTTMTINTYMIIITLYTCLEMPEQNDFLKISNKTINNVLIANSLSVLCLSGMNSFMYMKQWIEKEWWGTQIRRNY